MPRNALPLVILHQKREDIGMKIVVIKSPRFLTGLFRMIFKIKKESIEE